MDLLIAYVVSGRRMILELADGHRIGRRTSGLWAKGLALECLGLAYLA